MRKRYWLAPVLLAGLLVGLLTAQHVKGPALPAPPAWVPFVANKVERGYRISPDGQELIYERLGVQMRDSNGSIYGRGIRVSGRAPDYAVLEDALTGFAYRIDYAGKKAVVVRRPPPGPFEPIRPQTAEEFASSFPPGEFEYLGRQVISGLECVGYKIPTQSGDEVIPTWFAPSLNFMVVKLEIHPAPAPDQLHVMVLENIRAGERPDPKLFQIPDGFIVD